MKYTLNTGSYLIKVRETYITEIRYMVPDVKDVIQEFLVIHGPRKGNLLRPSKIK